MMHVVLFLSLLATALARPSLPSSNNVRTLSTPESAIINANLEFTPVARSSSKTSKISKRLTFTAGGRTEYCGESNPIENFGSDAPLQADCDSIASTVAAGTPGFYTLNPGDFNSADGWCKIATKGTCAFAIRYRDPAKRETTYIGTQDVHFYIQRYSQDAQNGRIGAVGSISCNNDTAGKFLFVEWGLIRP